jgi:choline-sulfatase
MKQPNILWICSDQQRFDALGCYGNEWLQTPHIDGLAGTGMLFETAFSQSPVCTPSRAAFLTGRYPRTTRCRQNGQSIPEGEILVTRLLHDAGYYCGLSGKLHLSPCNPRHCTTLERRIHDGYDEFHWSHHPNPDWPANEYIQWLSARGSRYHTPVREDCRYVLDGMPDEDHQATWCAQKAIDFIHARSSTGQPWLFSVNFFDPHHPFDPPAEYLERYLGRLDDIPLPNYVDGELDSKPVFQQKDHEAAYNIPGLYPFPRMSQRDHRMQRAAYWAMCDLLDQQVGRMIQALRDTGQMENTIVIYMSDHGEMLGDHGIYLKGPYFYEPAVRVPLIISLPGTIPGGRRSQALVELADLAPTLLELAGLDRAPGMQAKSLWSLLTGKSDQHTHRDDVYCEYYNALTSHREPAAHATMIRTHLHKLVRFHGAGQGELYDLEADPLETHNLWDETEYRPLRAEMAERLLDRMAWTVDPLPVREGGW